MLRKQSLLLLFSLRNNLKHWSFFCCCHFLAFQHNRETTRESQKNLERVSYRFLLPIRGILLYIRQVRSDTQLFSVTTQVMSSNKQMYKFNYVGIGDNGKSLDYYKFHWFHSNSWLMFLHTNLLSLFVKLSLSLNL